MTIDARRAAVRLAAVLLAATICRPASGATITVDTLQLGGFYGPYRPADDPPHAYPAVPDPDNSPVFQNYLMGRSTISGFTNPFLMVGLGLGPTIGALCFDLTGSYDAEFGVFAAISVDTIVQNTSLDGKTDLSFTVARIDHGRAAALVETIVPDIGASGLDHSEDLAKVSVVGTGMQSAPGYAARMFRALAAAKINIDMITTSDIRITCIISASQCDEAVNASPDVHGSPMTCSGRVMPTCIAYLSEGR